MRIVLAAGIYPPDPGGPAIHAEAFYKWLQEQGEEVILVAFAHSRHLPRLIRHIHFAYRLYRVITEDTIVYGYDALGVGASALVATKLKKARLALRVGGDIPWERGAARRGESISLNEWYARGSHKSKPSFYISRWVMRHAHSIVVTSPILASLYRKYYGIATQKLVIVPNPLPVVPELTSDTSEQSIIFASRLVPYKNLERVIETFSRILEDFPEVKLVIMGDGPQRGGLEKLSKKLGVEERVEFTGSLPQRFVLQRTAKSLLTIAPALTEFNPNYVLQGLAFDKPFLMSSEHGLPFKVPSELIFDPRSDAELEARLRYILGEKGYKEAQGLVRGIVPQGGWQEVLEANWRAIKPY